MNKRLPLSAGTVLQSRYTIVGQLGHGGMGAVYEAKDNRISASVALKETYADDDYTRNAFEREAKMLANMTHEAFPRVMDYFAEGDGFYLVMELIRGKDLSELLEERNAPFETEQVLEWADQILDALEDLHSQDIVHRDIKPSNLKLTPRGRIKLLDFGIAKGAAGDMTALQSTVGSMAAATLQYAPLEQVLRADTNWLQMLCVNFSDKTLSILDHGTDARSDLYALAATLYHLLTNTLPVNAPTRALSIWTGLADKLRPAHEINSKVSSAISTTLQKAMEIERNNRSASATEMRKMLCEGGGEAEEETIVAANEKTLPLLIKSVFQNPEPQGVKTEILNGEIPVDLFNANDEPVQETVTQLSTSRVESTKQKIFIMVALLIVGGLIGLLAYRLLLYDPKTNESGSTGNASNSPTGNSSNIKRSNGNSSNPTANTSAPGAVSKNSIGMEFVNIPAGSFMMGSANGNPDEKPVHRVTISQGLWIGKYEVTQGQWEQIMGTTLRQQRDQANKELPIVGEGADFPMYFVSWDEAKDFIRQMNDKNDSFVYSLPSESEWEYAARAGTTGDHYGAIDEIAWFGNNSGRASLDADYIWKNDFRNLFNRIIENGGQTHQVGTKKPNDFGLFDTAGNVWEWCEDIDNNDGYGGLPVDGSPNLSRGDTKYRVLRGGSWLQGASRCRSSVRYQNPPSKSPRSLTFGFRVAARLR